MRAPCRSGSSRTHPARSSPGCRPGRRRSDRARPPPPSDIPAAASPRRAAVARSAIDIRHRCVPFSVAAMRSTSSRATSSLDCDGQDSTPARGDEMNGIAIAAHDARRGRHVVGDDPVAALASQFGLGVLDHLFGLGGETDNKRRPSGLEFRHGREDVRVLGRARRRAAPEFVFLIFCWSGCGDAPVGDRGGEDRGIGRQVGGRPPPASRARWSRGSA